MDGGDNIQHLQCALCHGLSVDPVRVTHALAKRESLPTGPPAIDQDCGTVMCLVCATRHATADCTSRAPSGSGRAR